MVQASLSRGHTNMVKISYTIFLGILVATFVGVGIAAFYKAPQAPAYLSYPQAPKAANATDSAQIIQQEQAFQNQQNVYALQNGFYNRNVSLQALSAAVIILAGSLLLAQRLAIVADGFLLGSSLTLVYSIGRGFAAHDDMYQFLVVTISLAIVLFIGYYKFLRSQK